MLMHERDPETLQRLLLVIDDLLEQLDEQRLDLAAAHLDRCRDELRRALSRFQNGGT
jgi:hypothetical protein